MPGEETFSLEEILAEFGGGAAKPRWKEDTHMKKATVTVTFDDEKLGALEFSLRKEHSSVQEHLEDALNALDGRNLAVEFVLVVERLRRSFRAGVVVTHPQRSARLER